VWSVHRQITATSTASLDQKSVPAALLDILAAHPKQFPSAIRAFPVRDQNCSRIHQRAHFSSPSRSQSESSKLVDLSKPPQISVIAPGQIPYQSIHPESVDTNSKHAIA